ncbi:MAG: hypothetical protein HY815_05280 [Candidatus Riflebacteria bacterium]|nr:hypothetical protein [Candidatus Riflebacteria bacterium]
MHISTKKLPGIGAYPSNGLVVLTDGDASLLDHTLRLSGPVPAGGPPGGLRSARGRSARRGATDPAFGAPVTIR